jgi:oxygen-independent coproporphyrinogen-3 oxidase
LIYARQNQSLEGWRAELKQAIDMAVDHLSLYQLTIEQGTRFGDLFTRNRLRGLPTDELAADMYDITQKVCSENGLNAYEISNHARSGSECQHNQIYWNYGDYAGIGPGAHGRLTIKGQSQATIAPLLPETWLDTVQKFGTATQTDEILSAEDQAAEYIMMSLRLTTGTDLSRANTIFPDIVSKIAVDHLIDNNLLKKTGKILQTTERGKMILNAILGEILVKKLP